MKRMLAFLLLLSPAAQATKPAPAAPPPPPPVPGQIATPARALAEAFVLKLSRKEFADAEKMFDDAMTKAMPPGKLAETWAALLGQVGPFLGRTGLRSEKKGDYDVVIVTGKFQKAAIEIKVVVDGKTRKVTGLWFAPAATPPPPYQPPAYVKKSAFREMEVLVGSGEGALPASMTLPVGKGPFPAVVLLAGSGPNDRDETIGPNRPFRDLAWGLASRGIAVLRFEKRTHGHLGKLDPGAITIKEEYLDDAAQALATARAVPGIDGKRIVLLGHSEGAMLAPRIAANDPGLAGMVIMAGNVRPAEDVIVEQITYLSGGDAKAVEEIKQQAARVKDPKLSEATPAKDLPLGIPARYWLSLRGYDPAASAATLKVPALILQGERDYQVTMEDFGLWKKALAGRAGVTFKSYPALNHLFFEGQGKSKPDEYNQEGQHVAAAVIDDIAGFVKGLRK